MDEFAVIDEFFKSISTNRSNLVSQSIGDDAAVVICPAQHELLISTDTMVEGVHFLFDWPAEVVAYKALASNVSDIAAMGATPTWCSLALTIPSLEQEWLLNFTRSFSQSLKKFNVDLIGGDLSRGPLTISITIHGICPLGKSIKRSGAQKDDLIYLTGSLGAPSYAVSQLGTVPYSDNIYQKLFHPEPKLDYVDILQKYASSAIDISDGLSSDLNHILKASRVGATIYESKLPLDKSLERIIPADLCLELVLNSGDEYELCFTIPKIEEEGFEKAMLERNLNFFQIGQIDSDSGLVLMTKSKDRVAINAKGFKHF